MYDILVLSLFYIVLMIMSMMFGFMSQVQWIWGNPGLLLLAELYLLFTHEFYHSYPAQPFPICPVQFPLRNKSSPLTSPGLIYPLTSNPDLTEVSILVFHGVTLVSPLELMRSPLINISDEFLIPPLTLENNTVDKNVNPNDMVFIIDKIMESSEIVDLDQAMNPLQIDLTLNNWLVMFPKNVVQIPTLYHGDLLPQVIVKESPVQYILEQDIIFKEGLGYAFPMEKYHSTPAHPVHNQGFKIVQHDCHVFNKYFIKFYESLKPNEVLDHNILQEIYENPEHFINLEGDVIWKDGGNEYGKRKNPWFDIMIKLGTDQMSLLLELGQDVPNPYHRGHYLP
ncbi:hypothetical protein HD554DRAFT_2037730 [Boletus coccyginus]|nr:hypothetical protein HD554DRAFT_2037730 [Boletus coccyginus]